LKKFSRDDFLNAGEIIDRFKAALTLASGDEIDTDLDLAHFLDVAQSTIAGYRRRNKVPYELLVEAASKHDISLDHILLDRHTIDRHWLFPALLSHPGDTQLEPAIPVPPDRPWHVITNKSLSPGYEQFFIIEMPDNTMAPTLVQGDLLLVDMESNDLRRAAVYVLREDDTWLVRRAAPGGPGVKLIADNAVYPADIRPVGELNVAGEVVKVLKDIV